MTEHTPLDPAQLEERMDVHLDSALSSRRTAALPARKLSGFSRPEQDFVLHWGAVIARDNAELAYQFTAFAPRAMRLMDLASVESWLLYAIETVRLDACIARDFPGLHRDMLTLTSALDEPDAQWRQLTAGLDAPEAQIERQPGPVGTAVGWHGTQLLLPRGAAARCGAGPSGRAFRFGTRPVSDRSGQDHRGTGRYSAG